MARTLTVHTEIDEKFVEVLYKLQLVDTDLIISCENVHGGECERYYKLFKPEYFET